MQPVSYTHLDVYKRQLLDQFNMNKSVQNPDDCGVCGDSLCVVIHFLNTKKCFPADIHEYIVSLYQKLVINEGDLRECQ